jgi:hypothetical protein
MGGAIDMEKDLRTDVRSDASVRVGPAGPVGPVSPALLVSPALPIWPTVAGHGGGERERRESRRAKTDLFVNRFLNGHPYLCRMTDISLSGARLVAINEPRINPAPVHMGLQFQLPGRPEVVTASGEAVTSQVKTHGGRGVGIRFTRLPARAVAAIEALLEARPKVA